LSVAARRSHRGDEYQLRIALHWITRLILEDKWEWVQIEAVGLPEQNEKIFVDDIVIRSRDNSCIFIQAKKNQPDHKEWSISDLKDELVNALKQLENSDIKAEIVFYSQTPFGELGKYLEGIRDYETYEIFDKHAPKTTLKTILSKLAEALKRTEKATFALSLNMKIGDYHSFEAWNRIIKNDLDSVFHNPDDAIRIIEKLIRNNQSGLNGPFKLTREYIISELEKAGLPISPLRTEAEVLESFTEASRIGRANTSKKIAYTQGTVSETDIENGKAYLQVISADHLKR